MALCVSTFVKDANKQRHISGSLCNISEPLLDPLCHQTKTGTLAINTCGKSIAMIENHPVKCRKCGTHELYVFRMQFAHGVLNLRLTEISTSEAKGWNNDLIKTLLVFTEKEMPLIIRSKSLSLPISWQDIPCRPLRKKIITINFLVLRNKMFIK